MKPILHQLEIQNNKDGMSYIIQAEDGIIVIDGALTTDAEYLVNYLKKITGLERPCVDLWFLSHAHPDHTFCLMEVGSKYSDEIIVKKVVYHFPYTELLSKLQPAAVKEVEEMERAIDNLDGVERVIPRRGDVFEFEGLKLEVLFTWEDMGEYYDKKYNINDTSTVIRLTVDGQKIIFLGDASAAADKYMVDIYGEEELKSDVVQVAHHGGFGSTAEFYKILDPKFLLWPLRRARFDFFNTIVKANRVLLDGTIGIKDIFLSGNGTMAIPLPIQEREEPFLPGLPEPDLNAEPEGWIACADFAPNVDDPDDPAWLQAEEESFFIQKKPIYGGSPTRRMLWKDDRLYLKVGFYEGAPRYHSLKTSSLDSTCLSVFLSESSVIDQYADWADISEGTALNSLKLYPDVKITDGEHTKMLLRGTDREELLKICKMKAVSFDGGFCICAELKLSETKKSGDFVKLDMHVSIVEDDNPKRTGFFTLCGGDYWKYVPVKPVLMKKWGLK